MTSIGSHAGIRRARPEDADAIAAVHGAAWQESYVDLMPAEMLAALSVEERTKLWCRIMAVPDPMVEAAVFAACAPDGRILGFGCCGRQRATGVVERGFDGEFQAIYVLRAAQHRGTGRALMAAMARDLACRGMVGAALWVLEGNAAARGFYEALGGTVVGQHDDRHSEQLTFREVAYGWTALSFLAERAL